MSSSGTPQDTAPNSSGYWVSMLPTSSPPLEPPTQPSRWRDVTPREIRSFATAAKSSYARCRLSCSAARCQAGPYSPPPRMFATT